MKKFFLVLMLLVTSIAFADFVYYVKTDENGYVIDLTAIETALSDYEKVILSEPVKTEYLAGYYKFEDGKFILDEQKKQELTQPAEGE